MSANQKNTPAKLWQTEIDSVIRLWALFYGFLVFFFTIGIILKGFRDWVGIDFDSAVPAVELLIVIVYLPSIFMPAIWISSWVAGTFNLAVLFTLIAVIFLVGWNTTVWGVFTYGAVLIFLIFVMRLTIKSIFPSRGKYEVMGKEKFWPVWPFKSRQKRIASWENTRKAGKKRYLESHLVVFSTSFIVAGSLNGLDFSSIGDLIVLGISIVGCLIISNWSWNKAEKRYLESKRDIPT